MAWNEPNNSDKDKDPWGGKRKPDAPPDLEAALRDLFKKITTSLGFKEPSTPSGGGNFLSNKDGKLLILGFAALAIFIIWLLIGIFIVQPAEKAVVLSLGKYSETLGPGPHWIPRLIDSVYIVNEGQIANYSYDAQMLTKDENLVNVALAVQYRVNDAKNFLFNVVNPRESLQQATASALRQVIGHTSLDLVLTSGREQVRQEVRAQIENILQRYHTGLLVTDVAMQPAKAPDEVKDAFDDAIKAQEDEQRFINQAQAYAMQVVPNAQGQTQRLLADAKAYQQQISLQAKGDTATYLAVLPEYQKAPNVTRDRMYIDTLTAVLEKNSKVFIDLPGGNNMLYLPLDQLIKKNLEQARLSANTASSEGSTSTIPNQPIVPMNAELQNNDSYRTGQGGY